MKIITEGINPLIAPQLDEKKAFYFIDLKFTEVLNKIHNFIRFVLFLFSLLYTISRN